RFAGQAAGEEAAVILDPRTAAGRSDHLKVEMRALLQPLSFEQLAFGVKLLEPLGELVLDRLHRLFERGARRHVVRVGVDPNIVKVSYFRAGERIKFGYFFDIVTKEAY